MILESKQLKDFLIDTGLVTRSEYDEIESLIKKGKLNDSPENTSWLPQMPKKILLSGALSKSF